VQPRSLSEALREGLDLEALSQRLSIILQYTLHLMGYRANRQNASHYQDGNK
jgi:hypothetical protein